MKLSYSKVEESCNELHSIAKRMKESLDEVKAISRNLSGSESWSGSASNYYSKKLNKLTKSFDEVFIEIENSILFMASCSEGYQKVDQTIMREICSNLNITEPSLNTSKIFNR